ncbi:MAG TPA: hypothetical protein VGP08_22630 [Pyrinomonadaceae bacterium]|nr:hypothetical protein [Pyrinomonadaceae bacterium]
MRHNLMLLVFAAAVLTAGASLAASPVARQESKEKGGDSERAVKMKDMPAAVQQTVREQSRGAKIRGLSIETENGVTNYEVELRVNGHARDVLIDPSGAVVSVEEQVALASLPADVRSAIVRSANGGRVVLVESISKGGAVEAYEAHVKRGRKTVEIKVGPDGQLIP